MLRLVLLFIVIALVFGGMWRMLAPMRKPARGVRPASRMVRCARCDLYLPQEEALRTGEHYYCGEEHRLSGPRANER